MRYASVRRRLHVATLSLTLPLLSTPLLAGDDPFADAVVEFVPGTNGAPGFDDPTTALGSPERYTGEGVFPSAVTPFNSPFGLDELVSIGEGGHLVLRFDTPVRDDPANPFGIDLLIFGNAFLLDSNFPSGIVAGLGSEGGLIEVSADGTLWIPVPDIEADGLFPTLGYQDLTGPYDPDHGTIHTDFQMPVDPSITIDDLIGSNWMTVFDTYGRSGGGAGIDLAGTGLAEITHVRISNPEGSGLSPEIDAVSDVRHPADIDHDGLVGPGDLAQLLDSWGPVDPSALTDLNDDGVVGPADLSLLLDAWTLSP